MRGKSTAGAQVLWIAPTGRSAARVREQLFAQGLGACLSPGVTTFDQLAAQILAESPHLLSPINLATERNLVRRVVLRAAERGQLSCYAATAHSAAFVELVIEHIRELKRRGMTPELFAESPSRRSTTEEHQQLAGIYTEYQRLLAKYSLADREGVHWLARDLLSTKGCRWLDRLELVVVDGFTDFTPTQYDLMRLLTARSRELQIALPVDDEGNFQLRADLFAKTAATLSELKRQHRTMKIEAHAGRPFSFPALGYLAKNLFRDPRQAADLPADAVASLEQFEIVAAAGQHAEIVEIARRIKRKLVRRQARPGEIVVVFRTLPQVASRIREVFSEFGIPYFLESSERLIQSPLMKTLLGLLRLTAEDWPFRRVVSILTNNLLAALSEPARSAANWLVRELQIAGGREALLTRIEQLAGNTASENPLSEHQDRRVIAARAAPRITFVSRCD